AGSLSTTSSRARCLSTCDARYSARRTCTPAAGARPSMRVWLNPDHRRPPPTAPASLARASATIFVWHGFRATLAGECRARFEPLPHSAANALRGEATVDNIALRCRAHNVYEAELQISQVMAHNAPS